MLKNINNVICHVISVAIFPGNFYEIYKIVSGKFLIADQSASAFIEFVILLKSRGSKE